MSLEHCITYERKWPTKRELPFTINHQDERIKLRRIKLTIPMNNEQSQNENNTSSSQEEVPNINLTGVKFIMPDRISNLLWFRWPKPLPKPIFDENGLYHPIKVLGKNLFQVRRTLCYGHSYKYSRRTHPVEDEIPDDINELFKVTSRLYDIKSNKITPMCLANDYRNCFEYISEHSDDEKQFGTLNDIICWVVGASRKLIIREKIGEKKNISILEFDLPEGLYIMSGKEFQKNYTHEIPREYESWFKTKFCKIVDKYLDYDELNYDDMSLGDDDEIADNAKMIKKAQWMSDNPKIMRKELKGKKIRGKNMNYDEAFDLWNQRRTSYTIRYFK